MENENVSTRANNALEITTAGKKRKSTDFSTTPPRQQANPGVSPKGTSLAAPGFTRKKGKVNDDDNQKNTPRSGLKRPTARSAAKKNRENRGDSIQNICREIFGTIEERQDYLKALLRRSKPKQKLFGAAKQYCESETRRLANGIRDIVAVRDRFINAIQENDAKRLRAIDSLEVKVSHFEAKQKEEVTALKKYSERLANQEEKFKLKDIENEKLRLSLNEQKEIINKFETSEANLSSKIEKMKNDRKCLEEEFDLEKAKLLESHKSQLSQMEEKINEIKSRLEILQEKNAQLEEEIKEQKVKLIEKETKMKAEADEVDRRKSESLSLEKRNQNLEEKLDARDKQLQKALETFQENQAFSQSRIAALNEEKKELEDRVNDLTEQKSSLIEKNAKLAGDLISFEERLANAEVRANDARSKLEEELRRVRAHAEVVTQKAKKELEDNQSEHLRIQNELNDKLEAISEELMQAKEVNTALESELNAVKSAYSQAGNSNNEQLEKLYSVSREAEMLKRKMNDMASAKQAAAELERQLKMANEKLFQSEKAQRDLRNEIQELKGTVRVVARVRPAKEEADENIKNRIDCGVDETSLRLKLENISNGNSTLRSHEFKFNRSFGPSTSQAEIFGEVSTFVQSALDGYNVCLFSYGQTGSGKTYTMTGDQFSETHRGIIPRAVEHIMNYKQGLDAQGWKFNFYVTILEIYNESIRDLLNEAKPKLEIRDLKSDISVPGLDKKEVFAADDISELLLLAEKNRAVAATDANLHSSRSHSVFTLYINGLHEERGAELKGSLSLCDLAGSERLSKSGAQGDRLKETQAINKSLSAIADVFTALSKKSSHIPYRNSKLTHLLRPCFAGEGKEETSFGFANSWEGKVLMIVNLSSDPDDANESLCSLRFASHVNKTEVGKAKRNISKAAKK